MLQGCAKVVRGWQVVPAAVQVRDCNHLSAWVQRAAPVWWLGLQGAAHAWLRFSACNGVQQGGIVCALHGRNLGLCILLTLSPVS